jgi:DNA-directed RNA polymerase specialized sigma24 family protein
MQTIEQSRVMPSISSDMRALYDAHFELVWRYMAQRSVRQADIDELVHQVFRVVREHPCRQQMRESPHVLVCMIARQVLREHQRTEHGAARGDEADALTEIFERDAVAELLFGGLESMTDIEREAYLLCEGEGMVMADVALAVGVPELAVQRKHARARRQMHAFIAKMRSSGIWPTSLLSSEADLLRTVQAACTPSDRDRDRVFAAMIAYSLSTRAPRGAREPAAAAVRGASTPASRASVPVAQQAAPRAAEPTARVLAPSWLPPRVALGNSRAWMAAALAAALLAVGMGSHFVGFTRAAGSPVALRVAGESKTGANAEREASADRPLVSAPASAAAHKPAALAASSSAKPELAAKDPAMRLAQGSSPAADAGAHEEKGARMSEAKLLFAAQRAYLRGNAALALKTLAKHRRSYPSTAYTTERKVLEGQILCTTKRYRAAQRLVLELEAMEVNPAALAALYRVCSG